MSVVVGDVDHDLGAFADAQCRAGYRAVVGKHAHRVVPELLCDGSDPQVEGVAVGELDDLGAAALGSPTTAVEKCGRCRLRGS